jgi:hypothetical protein
VALPPLALPIETVLWTDWPADDLVVLHLPPGAHEGKISHGLPPTATADRVYSTNAFRAGGRWSGVVPSCCVPYFTTGAAGMWVAPAELQDARPPN